MTTPNPNPASTPNPSSAPPAPKPPMAEPTPDTITQLQTCLDQLATQFYASLRYITTHHPLVDFDGTPLSAAASLGLPAAPVPTSQQSQAPGSSAPAGSQASTQGQPGGGTGTQTQAQTAAPTPTAGAGGAPTPAEPASAQAQAAAREAREKEKEKEREKEREREREREKDKEGGGGDAPAKPPLSPTWTPLDPDPFALDVRELSADLVSKTRQMEELLRLLPPDLARAEQAQEARIAQLVAELAGLETDVARARDVRENLLERVESVIAAVGGGLGQAAHDPTPAPAR